MEIVKNEGNRELVYELVYNYDEVMKIKKKNNYDIEILGVSTFEEIINYLNNKK